MGPLGRDEIMAAVSFRPSKLVELDGLVLRIVGLSSAEWAGADESTNEADDLVIQGRMATVIRHGVVDDDRRPIFESAAEALTFMAKISMGASIALAGQITDLTMSVGPGKAGETGSSTTPSSSPDTTSPSSSADSPANSATSRPERSLV